jgi:hypothetical protein
MSRASAAFDGPIPPPALAAERWGAGAWRRLARAADAAALEARLRCAVAAAAALRARPVPADGGAGLRGLGAAIAWYRRAALGR